MKLSFTFLMILGMYQSLNAAAVKGRITDPDGRSMAYVNIGVPATTTGTVSDAEGGFYIDIGQLDQDIFYLKFSSLGYEDHKAGPFQKTALSDRDTVIKVELRAREYSIPQVEIVFDTLKVKTIGNRNSRVRMQNNLAISKRPGQNLGMAVGRKFRLGKDAVVLKKLKFYLSRNDFDSVSFRISFLNLENGKPGSPAISREILHHEHMASRGWISVDLDSYDIVLRGSIVVSLEWVGCSSSGSRLCMPITVPAPGAIHYYRFGSQNEWRRYPGMSVAMILEVRTP
jgi:hypothetical protein